MNVRDITYPLHRVILSGTAEMKKPIIDESEKKSDVIIIVSNIIVKHSRK